MRSTAVVFLKSLGGKRLRSAIGGVVAAVLMGLAQNATAHAALGSGAMGRDNLQNLHPGLSSAPATLHLAQNDAPASANAAKTVSFDIKAQPMETALTALGAQSGLTIIVETKVSKGVKAAALSGEYTADEALKKLLEPAGLKAEYLDSKTVAVRSAKDTARANVAEPCQSGVSQSDTSPCSGVLRVAQHSQTDVASNGQSPDDARSASNGSEGPKTIDCQDPKNKDLPSCSSAKETLQEVLVTAQKREERLQDVPVPVTTLSAQSLIDNNYVRLQDYFSQIPSVDIRVGNRGEPIMAIRGISTGAYKNPTVGIVIDDVPYGVSTSLGGGFTAPDLDPSDLNRVEVLRGPQGTLYGASSMGGLFKFVTQDPSTESVTGRLQVGSTTVHSGNEAGYSVRGAINVPLSETFAVRASAYVRNEPGYIDNVQVGAKNINDTDAHGGRVSALWRPSETLSLKVSALFQNSDRHGAFDIHRLPGLTDLQQSTIPGTGEYDADRQLYSATLTAQLGTAELTVLTGYNDIQWSDSIDNPAFRARAQTLFGVAGVAQLENNKTEKFTQEVRLAMPLGQRLQWLVGAFYTDEDTRWPIDYFAANPTTGARPGSLGHIDLLPSYEEYAAFTDLMVNFTERFDVQVGGRQSRNKQVYNTISSGTLFGGGAVAPTQRSAENAFTYLLTPRFKVSADLMTYMRFASGYLPGGPNAISTFGFPTSFGSSKTLNYEIGAKGAVLDERLSFDASLFYIDWQHLQVTVVDPVTRFSYTVNGGEAKSEGLELSVVARPLRGLTMTAWGVWNVAELTENFPATSSTYGASGNRLPYSSRFSGNLSLQQEFQLWQRATGYVGATLSYVGDRLSEFRGVAAGVPLRRQEFPSYTQLDLRVGALYKDWTLNLFVNNVADKRGLLGGGVDALNPNAYQYLQPRTVGLSLTKTFDMIR